MRGPALDRLAEDGDLARRLPAAGDRPTLPRWARGRSPCGARSPRQRRRWCAARPVSPLSPGATMIAGPVCASSASGRRRRAHSGAATDRTARRLRHTRARRWRAIRDAAASSSAGRRRSAESIQIGISGRWPRRHSACTVRISSCTGPSDEAGMITCPPRAVGVADDRRQAAAAHRRTFRATRARTASRESACRLRPASLPDRGAASSRSGRCSRCR